MGKTSSPFVFHGRAPLLIALIVCLASMTAFIGWERNSASETRALENRSMAPLPKLSLLRKDAPEFIKAMEAYLKDTVGFRLQANAIYRKLRYYVFRDAPLANVTVGRDGHTVLNSPNANAPDAFFDSLCLEQGQPTPELMQQVDETMTAAGDFFKRHGAVCTFAIAPSTLSLYPDKLPLQVAPRYRKACKAYPKRDHLLARLQRQGEGSGHYHVFYPYALFNAHKYERGFYPKERYHWEGKSAFLFSRHLTQASGVTDILKIDDAAVLTKVKDDIAGFFGFSRPVEGYEYHYPDRTIQVESVPWLREFSEHGVLTHLTTANSLTSKTGLMIANSFGIALAPHLARSFQHFYYLDLNMIRQLEQAAVFSAVAKRIQADYVFFVFDDVNVTTIPRRLAAFVQLEGLDSQQDVTPAKEADSGHPQL